MLTKSKKLEAFEEHACLTKLLTSSEKNVLFVFCPSSDHKGMAQTRDIFRRIWITRRTLHFCLCGLIAKGYIERVEEEGGVVMGFYRLTNKIFEEVKE